MSQRGGNGHNTQPHCPKEIEAIAEKLAPEDASLLTSAYFSSEEKVFVAVPAMKLALSRNDWRPAREYLTWCKDQVTFGLNSAQERGNSRVALFPYSAGNSEVW